MPMREKLEVGQGKYQFIDRSCQMTTMATICNTIAIRFKNDWRGGETYKI